MIDLNDKYLRQIEQFLAEALEKNTALNGDDLDPKEIIYQTIEQVRQNTYSYNGYACIPNIITISFPESKANRAEDLETIFNTPLFISLFGSFISNYQLRLFNPLHIEVQTVSKGNSRVMYRRAGLALDWPNAGMASENTSVVVDHATKKVLSVTPPQPQIPKLARLTCLNATVYQNRYLLTKPSINVGRMRSVFNEKTGKVIRRNDFVFAHEDIAGSVSNSVSRQHATIIYQNDNFFLYDLGSANGTAVQHSGMSQEQSIVSNTQGVKLLHGDIMRFGQAWVSFEIVPLSDATLADRTAGALPVNRNISNDEIIKLQASIHNPLNR